MQKPFARLLAANKRWSPRRIELFDRAFTLYWERTAALARRAARSWAPPRLRHVAVIEEPATVRPYAQLLNATAWTLYDSDCDPELSNPEFLAYLLVHGDRSALLGEVSSAAVHDAAYWFERGTSEKAAFREAAARSPRPDAAAFRVLAEAIDWLGELAHETLRPPNPTTGYRAIPGTGLLVPARLHDEPPALVEGWAAAAQGALDEFHARWRRPDLEAVRELVDWLASDAPQVVIVCGDRIVWDPSAPERVGGVRTLLRRAGGAAVRDVAADLRLIDDHTRRFLSAVVRPHELPAPAADTDSSGYTFLHRERRLLAYNLDEPEMERLLGPALPFARCMLGARALHEWAHLAAAAGWVPRTTDDAGASERLNALAEALDATIAAAPAEVRRRTADDLRALVEVDRCAPPFARDDDRRLVSGSSPGAALARSLLTRMPDCQANLLASRLWSGEEADVYVRHNVRTLRAHYPPARIWRMLIRYLYEYQYLRFVAVGDPRSYFLSSTWFDADFFATATLDETAFDRLAALVAATCRDYAVDETRIRLPAAGLS